VFSCGERPLSYMVLVPRYVERKKTKAMLNGIRGPRESTTRPQKGPVPYDLTVWIGEIRDDKG
jgi:hypothetical protein